MSCLQQNTTSEAARLRLHLIQVCGRPTRHNVDYAIRNPKRFVEVFCGSYHLVKHLPRFAIMRGGKDKLLNLQREEATETFNKIK